MVRGFTNREIADRLHKSVKTIEGHLAHVYDKLDVRSRAALVAAAALVASPEDSTAPAGA